MKKRQHLLMRHSIAIWGLASAMAWCGLAVADRSVQAGEAAAAAAEKPVQADTRPPAAAVDWQTLFDGKTLAGWKVTQFGGEGDVSVEEGQLILGMGYSLTGVNCVRETPKIDYEISLEAMRVDGSDFFCGLTFPVKDTCASLILGGWGGGVVGISCIDGYDASENDSSTYAAFKNGQWYTVRLRVTDRKIQAWIDKEQLVDQEIEGRKLSVRAEVDLSQPLGIACWETKAALKNIRLRKLSPQEIAADK